MHDRISEKTTHTVRENSVPDKPLFLTKLFNLYVYSQPLEVGADRTSLLPEEKAHTWTLKGGRNTSIKEKVK